MGQRQFNNNIGRRRAQASLGARLPVELIKKFDKKAKEEGRIKKILIVRLLKEHIAVKYGDLLEE